MNKKTTQVKIRDKEVIKDFLGFNEIVSGAIFSISDLGKEIQDDGNSFVLVIKHIDGVAGIEYGVYKEMTVGRRIYSTPADARRFMEEMKRSE